MSLCRGQPGQGPGPGLGVRRRARGCPGRAAPGDVRRATADRVARWPLVLSVSVPDGECIVVVGIVLSACAALRDKLLATHGTAWNQTRTRAALRRRACWHAGYARAQGRSGSSAPWPPGWLAAVQRSRGGGRAARQPRPSANGARQLDGSHPRARARIFDPEEPVVSVRESF